MTSFRAALPFLFLALLSACAAPPPEAPSGLGELSLYLFAEYEAGNDVVAEGLLNLEAVLLDLDIDWDTFEVDSPRDGCQWAPPLLEADNLHDVDVTGDPVNQLPVAVASVSDHGVPAHADLVALADQTPIETESSVAYEREFVSGVECFVDGSCPRVDTYDSIHRQNIVVDLWYEVTKSYLWVDLPDGRRAMIARSWAPAVFEGEGGNTSIDQSYNVAVWLPHPRGTLRYQVLWSSWTIPAIDNDDLIINTTAEGMDERYLLTEEYLAAQ